MTIDFTTSPGGLFRRLGGIFYAIQSVNLVAGSTDLSAGGIRALGVLADNIEAQYASTLQFVIDQLYASRDSAREALTSWKSAMRQLAETTVIEQAHADATLPTKDLTNALIEVIRQMANGNIYAPGHYVDANTVSASAAADSLYTNTGNGSLKGSVKRTDARDNMHVLAEVFDLVCDGDGQTDGGATARQETFKVTGENAVTDKLAFNWPGGSAASASLTCIDADQDASGNLLYNSNFDDFTTANVPDYWGAALVGVAGTDIFSEASVIYRASGKALKFTGTGGAPLSSIAQSFAVTTPAVATSGTSSTLKPNTVYAINFFSRDSGAGALAGVLEVRLIDGSNAQVTDDSGTDIKIQVAVGTLTASYAAYGGFFVTPKVMPSTVKFNVRLSTALTSGESIYVDDLAMCEATQLYTNGPWAAIFAGATNFIKDDKFKLTIANNGAGDILQYSERCFDMRDKGLQFPTTAGGTNIPDSYIT